MTEIRNLIRRGGEALEKRKNRAALQIFLAAYEMENDNIEVLLGLGESYMNLKKNDEALEIYLRAYELEPENRLLLLALGEIYRRMDKKEKSLEIWSRYLVQMPFDFSVITRIGDIHQQNQDYRVAHEYYLKALGIAPFYKYAVQGISEIFNKMHTGDKETQKRKNFILFFPFAFLPIMICTGMLYSLFSLYVNDFTTNKMSVGLIYTIGASSSMIVAPLAGYLCDKGKRTQVFTVSIVIFALSFFLYSFAKEYWHLILIQVIEGASWVAFTTSESVLISDLADEKNRGRAFGISSFVTNLGWIIGPLAGGWFIDFMGFNRTLFFGSFFILTSLPLFFFMLYKTRKRGRHTR